MTQRINLGLQSLGLRRAHHNRRRRKCAQYALKQETQLSLGEPTVLHGNMHFTRDSM